MGRKSYDQRLKERWKLRQKKADIRYDITKDFYKMEDLYAATAWIMPFLFGKRNR